jgi:uncharacterized Tic20 family protein
VAYQSWQAFLFQLVVWVGGGILTALAWTVTGVLSTLLVGLLCIPFACIISLLPLAGLVYGVVGALQCNQGQEFRYWLVGGWARSTLPGTS